MLDGIKLKINECKLITDRLGLPIDVGIIKQVAILRYLGFPTTGSCQGHKKWGLPYPWIEVNIGTSNQDALSNKYWGLKLNKYFKKLKPKLLFEKMGIYNGFRLRGLGLSLITDRNEMLLFCDKMIGYHD